MLGNEQAPPSLLDADLRAVAPFLGGFLSLGAIGLGELGDELVKGLILPACRFGNEVPFRRLDQVLVYARAIGIAARQSRLRDHHALFRRGAEELRTVLLVGRHTV